MNITIKKENIHADAPSLQTVLVHLKFSPGKLDEEAGMDAVFELQDILTYAITKKQAGYVDGNEFCEDDVTFYIYGQDADRITDLIAPYVLGLPVLQGSHIYKIYGDDARAEKEYVWLK